MCVAIKSANSGKFYGYSSGVCNQCPVDMAKGSVGVICVSNDSKVPLYQQIYEQIRDKISAGDLVAGSRLTSTRSLAKDMCVARNTVESAYAQLCLEGYIASRPGAGFVVQDVRADILPFREVAMRRCNGQGSSSAAIKDAFHDQADVHYDFQYTNLDHTLFPSKDWHRLTAEVLTSSSAQEACNYGDKQGDIGLRREIVTYLRDSRGVQCIPEQVILCCGTQYALDVICQVLGRDTTEVAVEEPGYDGAKIIFQHNRYAIHPVSVGDDGIDMEQLKKCSAKHIYITPSHQFPTGVVMSIKKRVQLLQWARQRNGTIIEDDYDSELRYGTRPIPSLQSIDSDGRVIYIGTFSKSLSPGLRMSYIIMPQRFLPKYHEVFAGYYSTVPWMNQKIMSLFIARGYWDRHLRRVCLSYRRRHDMLVQAIDESMHNKVRIHGKNAGLHVLIEFLNGEPQEEMIVKARRHGVKVYPTAQYWQNKDRCFMNCILVGFSSIPESRIVEGVKALNRAWFECYAGDDG